VLGVSRDAEMLAHLFDENQESVRRMIRMLIEKAHAAGRPVGICGEGPSNNLEFAAFLVEAGIDSISLAPDTIVQGIHTVARAEARVEGSGQADREAGSG
jgi:pyruvate,water dikinase